MKIGVLTLMLDLGDVQSLKAKRSVLSPITARLHKEFNISVSEMGQQDSWNQSILACVMAANDAKFLQKAMETIRTFFQDHWPNIEIVEYHIEII